MNKARERVDEMFRWLINWFIGQKSYRIPPESSSCAASLLFRSGIDTSMTNEDGYICFSLPLPECSFFEALLDQHGISFEASEVGFGRLISRYKGRPGIFIGVILFFVIVISSRDFVWSIDIIGNDKLSREELLSELAEQGFEVGTRISELDLELLHTNILQADRRIAWISVNLFGTHASVELRESETPQKAPDETTPYNLIASEDGIIESIDIYRGTKAVSVGDPVRKGELLASGVVETPRGFELVHARGVVKANVKREITVSIPLEYDKKVYTGREYKEISLKILSFSLKIFKNTGNMPSNCDIIDREHRISFLGIIELPVTVCKTTAVEYTLERASFTEDEARKKAYSELRRRYGELDGEILTRELETGLSEDKSAYVINCRMRVMTDIALESEIYR